MNKIEMNDEHILLCPSCGESNLHHCIVGVYNRVMEDSTHGIHLEVNGGVVTQDKDLSGNPSKRRNGIAISFTCEQCDDEHILNIIQHQGQTKIGWEYRK